MSNFKTTLQRFISALDAITFEDIKEKKEPDITDFDQKKKAYQIDLFNSSFKALLTSVSSLDPLKDPKVNEIKSELSDLKQYFEEKDFEKIKQTTANILLLESKLEYPQKEQALTFKIPNIPSEIAADMKADVNELEKCFKAEAYRASVILCGRLLETALHAIYFKATNNDLLEKSPGIGLGNLIAKIKEQGIQLDPAITQQIHLINQVRIYSVHKKQQAFDPTKEQTNAIILYTVDIIKKLFS